MASLKTNLDKTIAPMTISNRSGLKLYIIYIHPAPSSPIIFLQGTLQFSKVKYATKSPP